MKKALNTSIIYFVLAIAAGVFHREFTKFNGFTGETVLGNVHTHLLVLGTFLFLIVALFCIQMPGLSDAKIFKQFYLFYNISLPFMAAAMLARGILQVRHADLERAADAALSGMAGISHIFITIAFALLFAALKRNAVISGKNS